MRTTAVLVLLALPILVMPSGARAAETEEGILSAIKQFEWVIADYEKYQRKLQAKVDDLNKEIDKANASLQAAKAALAKHESKLAAVEAKLDVARNQFPELLTRIPQQVRKRNPHDPLLRRKYLDLTDWGKEKVGAALKYLFGFVQGANLTRGMSKTERERLLAAYKQATKAKADLIKSIDAELQLAGFDSAGHPIDGLEGLKKLMARLEAKIKELEAQRALVNADIDDAPVKDYRKRIAELEAKLAALRSKKSQAAERKPEPAVHKLPAGEIWFVRGVHLPTPRGPKEIPVELEVHGSFNATGAIQLMRIFLNAPAATKYQALFRIPKGEKAEDLLETFTEIGEEFQELMSAGYRSNFQSGPLRYVSGSYEVELGGKKRYYMTRLGPRGYEALGKVHFYGMAPGRHEVTVRAIGGQRRFAGKRTLLVMKTKRTIAESRAAAQKHYAAYPPKGMESASAESRAYVARTFLKGLMGVFAQLGETPGCTPSDLHGALAKASPAIAELLGSPLMGKGWGSPYKDLGVFATQCVFTGTEEAYQHLASIAAAARTFADKLGTKRAHDAADRLYGAMADISFSNHRIARAIQNLNKQRSKSAWPELQDEGALDGWR